MTQEELLQIIQQAAEDQVTSLHLSGKGLTKLPPEIGQLSNLTRLHLGGNPLTSPPPEILEQGIDATLAYLREQLHAQ